MIDLRFGKYGIKTADRLNIVLYENIENKKEDSPNYGKTSQKVLGYYGELEHALNAYVKVAMADDELTFKTVEELIKEIDLIRHSIRHECGRLMRHRQMLRNMASEIPVGNGENYEVTHNGK